MALGIDGGAYCIWDRNLTGPPLLRFPLTDDGWARAWEEFTRLEEGEAIQAVEEQAVQASEAGQAIQASEAEPPSQTFPPASAGPRRTDPRAIASVVLGLVGILPVGVSSIAAFVLAAQARRRIERGETRGGGLAIAGTIISILGMGWTALFTLLLVAVSSCGFLEAPPDAPAWCNSNGAPLAIWGGVWVGELLLAIAFAPKSRKFWTETGVAVGIVAAIMLAYVLIVVINNATKTNHPKAFPSIPDNLGVAPTFRPLSTIGVGILSDDFADPGSGWHEETNNSFSFGYFGAEYRIEVKAPSQYRYWVMGVSRSYFEVRVAADVRRGSGVEGTFGILCEANGSDQDGYVFLVDPDRGTFDVRRLSGGSTYSIGGGASLAIHRGSGINSLEGYCDHTVVGGPTALTLYVNGVRVTQIEDSSYASFTGIGMYAESHTGSADARFDNLELSI